MAVLLAFAVAPMTHAQRATACERGREIFHSFTYFPQRAVSDFKIDVRKCGFRSLVLEGVMEWDGTAGSGRLRFAENAPARTFVAKK